MSAKRRFPVVFLLLVACLMLGVVPRIMATTRHSRPAKNKNVYYAGLRRSVYGLRKKNRDDLWWVKKAKEFAAGMPVSQSAVPTIIHIVSVYLDDGTTKFTFSKPKNYTASTRHMIFRQGPLDHEKALTTYDEQGVKAIIQLEPGDADIPASLDIVQMKFGRHPCIIGYGIDAEWYCPRRSKDNNGLSLRDSDVALWLKKVMSFNPDYTLFLKHWLPSHMPPSFRHPNLWFLSDSQNFQNVGQLLEDLKYWNGMYQDHVVGYQYGYESDRRWWRKMRNPTVEISRAILTEIPNARFLFWVDFTANKVNFARRKLN